MQKWFRVAEENATQNRDVGRKYEPKEDIAGRNLDTLVVEAYMD